mmetsp:Transcript_10666/g.33151  ORF Transcript_10666/g.33151 Transcript_10666/m.33151 type:complete len:81 (-) Transcript_10666:2028-2270(-)
MRQTEPHQCCHYSSSSMLPAAPVATLDAEVAPGVERLRLGAPMMPVAAGTARPLSGGRSWQRQDPKRRHKALPQRMWAAC